MEINTIFNEITTKFSNSSDPFELFATRIAEAALFDLEQEVLNDFAILIFNFDWKNYKNIRNGTEISLNEILAQGLEYEHHHIEFIQTYTEYKNHDHSKDDFYILICCLRFRCPDFNTEEYKWFVRYCNTIVFRNHYKTEPHHPEYELYVKDGECTLKDVEETALDRLARHFQFGGKSISSLNAFKPTWSKNSERNTNHYDMIIETKYNEIGSLWNEFMHKKLM